MRIAISNLAWDTADDAAVCALLQRYGVDAIDVAPGKYFLDFFATTDKEIACVRDWWQARGIELTGMQALLFGTTGLNLFGTKSQQDAMLSHLEQVCRIGAGLGARKLAFGSPRNRDRSSLSDGDTRDIARSFFSRLGAIAAHHGVVICLEPNPPCYGANFLINAAETAEVVADVSHPAIRMLCDTGAAGIAGEDLETFLSRSGSLVAHVHLSEPNLVPLGCGGAHVAAAAALNRHLSDRVACIEMLQVKNAPALPAIEEALQVAIRHYREKDGEGRVACT